MKKTIFLALAMLLSFQVFSQLSANQLTGKWKYTAETADGSIHGIFKFVLNEEKLAGDVITDDGYIIPFVKIEIREENKLYLEVKTESDVIKITVKVIENGFEGTGTYSMGESKIKGIKVE